MKGCRRLAAKNWDREWIAYTIGLWAMSSPRLRAAARVRKARAGTVYKGKSRA